MAATPALPLAGYGAPVVNQWYTADREIPAVFQPNFGIAANGLIPGTGPMQNAFYNPLIQYFNQSPYSLPTVNQTVDWYAANIPGLINTVNNSGAQG